MKRSLRIVYFKNANHIKEDVKLVRGDWVGYPCTLEERGLRSLAVARTKPPAPWSAEGPTSVKYKCIASMTLERFRPNKGYIVV